MFFGYNVKYLLCTIRFKYAQKKNYQEENKRGCGEKCERAILFTYSINFLFSFAQQSLDLKFNGRE